MRFWIHSLIITLGVLFSTSLWATCVRVTSTTSLSDAAKAAGYTASTWTGACDYCNGKPGLPAVISLNSGSNFQPSGTLLASGVASFLTGATNISYTANQILFRCDVADASSLYEFYATNGDSTWAGHNASSEVDGAYYDYVKNVAVRLTNMTTGQYYSRYWKSRQFTASDWYSDGTYIYIPASAFSNVLYELFKITSTTYYYEGSNRYVDAYAQPKGYIAFKGPGISDGLVDGGDSSSNYAGWYSGWPGAWGTDGQVTYVRGAICQVSDYPTLLLLPRISVPEMQAGGVSQVPFSVSLQCESGAISSTATSTSTAANVAMGFLVNQPVAVAAATKLGLVTSGGGLTWLLDTQYGNSGVASGVGIRIYNSNGTLLNLLPDQSSMGTGNTRGWYAYKDLTTLVSTDTVSTYSGDFTASLEAISGQTITAGTVNAQLQVVVSFQ